MRSSSILRRAALVGGISLIAASPAAAQELFVPYLVKDINPGAGDSPDSLTQVSGVLNGSVYFRADDGVHGLEIWKTDGTAAGTQMLTDLRPGPDGSFAMNLQIAGGQLYFHGVTSLPTGSKVFTSDGTAEGTTMLVDTWPAANIGFFGPEPPGAFTTYGDKVIFRATSEAEGLEMWITDGTPGGTSLLTDLHPGEQGSVPVAPTVFDGKVYFGADDKFTSTGGPFGVFDRELFVTDGTAAGTVRLKDINPGPEPSRPEMLQVLNNKLIFRADDGTHGTELWTSDGTEAGTQLLVDINPTGGSGSQFHTVVGDRMFFTADDGTHGSEIWLTDGTAAGTGMIRDINAAGDSTVLYVTAAGDRVFFSADDGTHGSELWVSDGTSEGTRIVKDINPGSDGASPMSLVSAGELVFFTTLLALDEGATQTMLWMSDGSEDGTQMLFAEPGRSFGVSIDDMAVVGDKLIFFAPSEVDGDGFSFNRELHAVLIPEPGAGLALAGLGSVALLRRRRR